MKTIAEEIEIFLRESGVTEYRLAKEAGLHRVVIWRICNGGQKDILLAKAKIIYAAMRRIDAAAADKALA